MTSLPVVPHRVTVVDCVLHTHTGEKWRHQVFQGQGEVLGGRDPTTEAAAAGTGTRRRLVIQCLMDCIVYKLTLVDNFPVENDGVDV